MSTLPSGNCRAPGRFTNGGGAFVAGFGTFASTAFAAGAFVTAGFADGLDGGFGLSTFGFAGLSAWDGRVSPRPSHHHKPPPITAAHRTATAR